jgi:hypothetical protein
MTYIMTDRDLIIHRFVDKFYELSDVPTHNGNLIPFGIKQRGEYDESPYAHEKSNFATVGAFSEYVTGMYSDFDTDEGITVTEMIESWFKVKYDIIYKDINDYLTGYVKISLGMRNWETKVNGQTWFWKELINIFDDKYSEKAVKAIYDKWYRREVERISHEAMNEPFIQ